MSNYTRNFSSKRTYNKPANSYHKTNRKFNKSYIEPSKFIQKATVMDEAKYVAKHKFSDFALDPLILNNLRQMQLIEPSAIQDQAIPISLSGEDIVGIASTGTGKTAAFAITLLNKLIVDKQSVALILAPTRELAQQIEDQCRQIAKGSRLDGALLIGGMPINRQLAELKYNPRIIIGTPGRVKDHIERKSFNPVNCNLIVLDEVDRMLDMGFINDITSILNLTSENRQSYYFSATIDERVKNIINRFSADPKYIIINSNQSSNNVEQNIIEYHSQDDKLNKLDDLLKQQSTTKTLIFDDTHHAVERLTQQLYKNGHSIDAIHGGKSQAQRQRVLNKFKNNEITTLVATDVAARGIDILDISHVVNYNSPNTYEDYIHRIGRTGRAGKQGTALTFVEKRK